MPPIYTDFLLPRGFTAQVEEKTTKVMSQILANTLLCFISTAMLIQHIPGKLWHWLGTKLGRCQLLHSISFVGAMWFLAELSILLVSAVCNSIFETEVLFPDFLNLILLVLCTLSIFNLHCFTQMHLPLALFVCITTAILGTNLLRPFLPKLLPWFYTPLAANTMLAQTLSESGFDLSKIFLILNSEKANAHTDGHNIFIHHGLLTHFNNEVVMAAVAHEFGHAFLSHCWIQGILVITFVMAFLLVLHFVMKKSEEILTSFGFFEKSKKLLPETSNERLKEKPSPIVPLIFITSLLSLPLIKTFLLIYRLRQHYQEFQADAWAVKNYPIGVSLIELLVRLHALGDALPSDPIYTLSNESHPNAIQRINAIYNLIRAK